MTSASPRNAGRNARRAAQWFEWAPPDWQEILTYFRGSELQNYFTKILEDDLKAIVKPQYVDQIPKTVKGTVGSILSRKDDTKTETIVCEQLDLTHLRDRNVEDLSGGELQRFACAVVCIQRADIFMFDEPSSYLDVKQRLKAAITIRSLISPDRYIIVVEHDLSVLDYLSDFICCLYGVPSAYGVVTMPFSVREGINIFLDGYVPTENLRFRETSLVFKVAETANEEEITKMCRYQYPRMKKQMGDFELEIIEGEFTDSEIMVMLGENGTGKTTFIRMLAGRLKPDEGGEVPVLNVSYKPQKISPKFKGSVRQLLHEKIRDAYTHPQFVTDVMKPLQIENIIDQDVQNLSGGELQRVALALCLGKPADVYLIDEPSAYLDSEQRLIAARVIKRFILHAKKTAFVVEHDFIMATYLADRVIVFDGIPSRSTAANMPQTLLAGMNKFLGQLEITFRRDPNNFRPRINKMNSIKDVEQKKSGNYFFLDD
ncbi:ATP-binding cassette sub-family E member 1 isoform X2 [Acipenser ruthenus]|uniref:ATP-binding cassette sub-family E member 1 isoform X2 n=1 Tax=Acipenser ruthenus TaxID=7906 RepID=UPI00145B20AC|nr:ATP-binding cassette sub-family E member 1 isoform X2 [Acipenser ruthenus]